MYEKKYANTKEISKLVALLGKEGIPFELRGFLLDNELSIQVISPSIDHWKIDAVCHAFSYGGEQGLIEIMMPADDVLYDGVDGYLTAEKALEYFKKALKA